MKTNVAETSLHAHREASGIHSTQELRVLADVKTHPGTTRKEIATRLGIDNSSVSARVNSLRELDQIQEGLPRKCVISQRKAKTLWATPYQQDWLAG